MITFVAAWNIALAAGAAAATVQDTRPMVVLAPAIFANADTMFVAEVEMLAIVNPDATAQEKGKPDIAVVLPVPIAFTVRVIRT